MYSIGLHIVRRTLKYKKLPKILSIFDNKNGVWTVAAKKVELLVYLKQEKGILKGFSHPSQIINSRFNSPD